MFNPDFTATAHELAKARIVVVDGVLTEPQSLRDLALKHWPAFVDAGHNAFPGPELALPSSGVEAFTQAMQAHAGEALGLGRLISGHARLSVVTRAVADLSPMQRMCHRDRLQASPDQIVVAGVLYLFADLRLGGTNFFEPRMPAAQIDAHMHACSQMSTQEFEAHTGWPASYMLDSNAWFERIAVMQPKFNRMIWYDGSRFHGSHITDAQLLVANPMLGRLTLNVFAVCERA